MGTSYAKGALKMSEKVDMQRIKEGLALMLAKELHSYCISQEEKYLADRKNYDTNFFTPIQARRIIEIGQFLNAVGGLELMQAACSSVSGTSQLYLGPLWNGIGQWRD